MSNHTWKTITAKAEECLKNVNKNYKLGISSKWGYIFAQAIITPRKNIPQSNLNIAPKPRGDKVKLKIPKEDYKYLAKRLIAFCEKNNRLPNYLTYNSKRIRCRLYVQMFAQVINYYNKNQYFPHNVNIDYSVFYKPKPQPTYKKYGHSTEYGCDNRGQNNGYYCGPHIVQEIIRNLTGKVISQSTLAEVIGTTTDGSDHDGINTSFAWFNRKYGYNLKVQWYNFSDLGWDGIKKILESNNQDCGLHELYRDTWGHYTNYDKVYDDYVDVHNSLGDYCSSSCYCGYTEERDKSDARRYLSGIEQKSVLVVTNES